MEKVGMRGRSRESEPVETPPHQAEFWLSLVPCRPLPASGARKAVPAGVLRGPKDVRGLASGNHVVFCCSCNAMESGNAELGDFCAGDFELERLRPNMPAAGMGQVRIL